MPKLTADRLLQRAMPLAAQHRVSLADAYGNTGPEAAEALAHRDRILALRGKHLRKLTPHEQTTAMRAFVFAEQWVQSLADSSPGLVVERLARANLDHIRALRRHLWGRTQFEAAMEGCTKPTKPVLACPGLSAAQEDLMRHQTPM